jgi:acetate kinase
VISCHLGGSSSVTGIRNGVGIGNSMGMTPQTGLPHNNRVGDLDAFALGTMMRTAGLSLDEAEQALCRDAGLKGLSGGYNDVRDLQAQAAQGNAKARLALDFLAYECRRWIGAFLVQLNGLDALVFTAGIGENQTALRPPSAPTSTRSGSGWIRRPTRRCGDARAQSAPPVPRSESWSSRPTKNWSWRARCDVTWNPLSF